jgi:hypothetical protein
MPDDQDEQKDKDTEEKVIGIFDEVLPVFRDHVVCHDKHQGKRLDPEYPVEPSIFFFGFLCHRYWLLVGRSCTLQAPDLLTEQHLFPLIKPLLTSSSPGQMMWS